jgi:hypothetical protein
VQSVGSVPAIVASVESNSTGTSSVRAVAFATLSLTGAAAATDWLVAAMSPNASPNATSRERAGWRDDAWVEIHIVIPSDLARR